MKARCALMDEAMTPCDALVCASMRCGAVQSVRSGVVRWGGMERGVMV